MNIDYCLSFADRVGMRTLLTRASRGVVVVVAGLFGVVVVAGLLGVGLVGGGAEAEAAAAPAAKPKPALIVISNFEFTGQLTVLPGETITVKNADLAPHTLTAVDGSFTTAVIQPGKSATLKAPKKVGAYAITCKIHPHMTGTLTVVKKPPKHPVVTIKNFTFTGQLVVRPGATITVKNADTAPHTLTAVDGSFTTKVIQPGKSATVKAPKKPGAYPITCKIHPDMMGTLTVVA
jgi:plastocyanin